MNARSVLQHTSESSTNKTEIINITVADDAEITKQLWLDHISDIHVDQICIRLVVETGTRLTGQAGN